MSRRPARCCPATPPRSIPEPGRSGRCRTIRWRTSGSHSPAFNAFRGTDWMAGALPSLRAARDRFRRLPLPGLPADRRRAGDRSGLSPVAGARRIVAQAAEIHADGRMITAALSASLSRHPLLRRGGKMSDTGRQCRLSMDGVSEGGVTMQSLSRNVARLAGGIAGAFALVAGARGLARRRPDEPDRQVQSSREQAGRQPQAARDAADRDAGSRSFRSTR